MPLDIFGDFGFVGADNTTANPYQDRQQCINFYPEISVSRDSKVAVSLLGCPGLNQLAGPTIPPLGANWPLPSTVTNLPVRGEWPLQGTTQALAVVANTCYLVTIATPATASSLPVLALTKIGTLLTSVGPVSIRDNGIGGVAVIVDGPFGYYYVYGVGGAAVGPIGTFIQITDPAFLGANRVAEIDGWWIFNQPGTQVFYTNSAPYSTVFAGSFFALKDSATDLLMGVMESKEELWLPGERTTEIWYDAGGAYFPFQRLVGTMLQVGCKATHSIARISKDGEDGLIWFGRSELGENLVIMTRGLNYQVVSTPAVSDAWAQYPVTSDAIGYSYQEDGHVFYVLTFPTADATWTFDASVPLEFAWTQRLSYDPYAQAFHRHRSNCCMNFAGMRVVGDYQNGALYQLTRNAYTDAGWPILARRRAPHIWKRETRQRLFMASLQVEFSPGVGTATGIGATPVAQLRISRNGGQSYGQQWPGYLGQMGDWLHRCIWRRLSFGRDNVVQVDVIGPHNRDIVGATLKALGET